MTTTTNPTPAYLADVAPELVGILADPASDDERLILADFLEERGEVERAEFIRVQVELDDGLRDVKFHEIASHDRWSNIERCRRSENLIRREKELFDRHKCEWFGESTAIHYLECEREDSEGQYPDCLKSIVRRGFIFEVHAPLAVLLQHLPALVRAHPIERVRTDKEPDHYAAISELWPDHWSWWSNNNTDPSSVKKQIWNLLDGFDPGYTSMEEECRNYPTAEAAHGALSDALLKSARG